MTTNFEKIYIFDFTGFLLGPDLKVSDKVIKYLKKLKAEGHGLGLMTSRSCLAVSVALPDEVYPLFDLVVSHNGARIDYTRHTDMHKLPVSEIDQFINEDAYKTVCVQDGALYGEDQDALEKIAKAWGVPKLPKHYMEDLHDDVLSLTLYFDSPEERDEWYETLSNKINKSNINLTKIKGQYIVVTAKEASRLGALKAHLINSEIIYYGNSYEDIEVFESKKLNIRRVALKGSPQELIDVADEVLDPTTDVLKVDKK